jgi:isocitrate dehydrogenase
MRRTPPIGDGMAKTKVKTMVVEFDRDEMTRITCGFIKNRLILPYLGEFELRLWAGS